MAATRDEREVFRATIGPIEGDEATLVLTERRLILRWDDSNRLRAVPLAWFTRVRALPKQERDGTVHGVEAWWRPERHEWETERRLWLPCRNAEQAETVAEAVRGALPRPQTKWRQRRQRLADDLDLFLRQYARRKPKGGGEPNDRDYDDRLAARVGRMNAEEFDTLLRHEFEESQDEDAT